MTILGYIAWSPSNDDDDILYILNIIRLKHKLKLSFMKHPNQVKNTSMAVEISGLSLRLKGNKKAIKKVENCINDMKTLLNIKMMTYTFDTLNFY